MRTFKLSVVARRIVVAVVSLMGVAGVQAQVVGQAGPFATPLSARSVEMFTSVLGLDADQKAVARSLYAGYRSDYRRAADKGDAAMQAQSVKLQEDGNQANYEEYGKVRIKVMREFVAEIERLEKSYMEDLKAILTPEQAGRFERAEQARRREVGARFAIVSGEGVDLFAILREHKVDRDGSAELKDVLDPYEQEIDRALVAKNALMRRVLDQMERLDGANPDPAEIEKIMEEFFTAGMRLRDAHRSCVRRMLPLLPADKQEGVDRAVKLASFPRVYAESGAEKTIKAALAMADLSADQRLELESIRDAYLREADGVNARWATAIESKQADLPGKFMTMGMGMGEEKPDDPLTVAREARVGLDDRTMKRVSQVLTPAQRETMPKIEMDTSWHGHEFMPDFDEMEGWEEWKKEDEN